MDEYSNKVKEIFQKINECQEAQMQALKNNDYDKLDELTKNERMLNDELKDAYVNWVNELLVFANMKTLSGDTVGAQELKKKSYEIIRKEALYIYFDDEKLKEIGFSDEEVEQIRKFYQASDKPKKI